MPAAAFNCFSGWWDIKISFYSGTQTALNCFAVGWMLKCRDVQTKEHIRNKLNKPTEILLLHCFLNAHDYGGVGAPDCAFFAIRICLISHSWPRLRTRVLQCGKFSVEHMIPMGVMKTSRCSLCSLLIPVNNSRFSNSPNRFCLSHNFH